MTTYRFAITGLRHHDFANRLDELSTRLWGSVCRRKALKAFHFMAPFLAMAEFKRA